ncbi:MAG: hypothetical protein MZV70_49795 [Desulfobacterales bacterium]|nr:hypothetical protein [Desulfobacterales bacterium]
MIAGGVACFLNPEPIAAFVDCFLIGEAEVILPGFLQAFTPGAERRSAAQDDRPVGPRRLRAVLLHAPTTPRRDASSACAPTEDVPAADRRARYCRGPLGDAPPAARC